MKISPYYVPVYLPLAEEVKLPSIIPKIKLLNQELLRHVLPKGLTLLIPLPKTTIVLNKYISILDIVGVMRRCNNSLFLWFVDI